MSQQYTIQGLLTLTNNNVRTIVTLAESTTCTSSTAIMNNASLPTGSWIALDTGSNASFRFGYFSNTNETSSVKIALGSTASNASILQPGDFCILTNDAAAQVYAYASGSASPVILQYVYVGK